MALTESPTLVQIVDEMERLNNLIVDRGGAKTITPSTTNQVLSKGTYKGDITVNGDANLIANNIVAGKSIFGISGNVSIQSLGGKRWAEASLSNIVSTVANTWKAYTITTNLNFTPSKIFLTIGNIKLSLVNLNTQITLSSCLNYNEATALYQEKNGYYIYMYISNITSSSFNLYIKSYDTKTELISPINWYAYE